MTSGHRVPVVALAALLAAIAVPARAQTFTFERSFALTGTPVIDVETDRGKVDVRRATGDRVEVIGRVTVRLDWNVPVNAVELAQMAAAAPPVDHEGQTIRIRLPRAANIRDAVTIAYELRVPATATVTVRSDSGEVRVDDVTGVVDVRTQSGAISLVGLASPVRVESGSGAVFLDRIASGVNVTTSSSAITAHGLTGRFFARTGSGRVTAVFTGDGDADVQTSSSAVSIDNIRGGALVTTDSGALAVAGDPKREWRLSSGSSAIVATILGSAPVTIDAASSSSDVELDPRGFDGSIEKGRARGRLRGGGVPVGITSRSGRIKIVVPGSGR